jgi:hypothetical protein
LRFAGVNQILGKSLLNQDLKQSASSNRKAIIAGRRKLSVK